MTEAEYRKPRRGSFGSIHGVLNHIILGDRIWMARFEGVPDRGVLSTPPLKTILFDEFTELRSARVREDERIEGFFAGFSTGYPGRSFSYINNQGKEYVESAPVAPPSLDLHRIINP